MPLRELSSVSRVRVSVVIPTFDSAGVLGRCLRSLVGQSWPVDEVIVVDGFSVDGTREMASAFGAEVFVESGTQAAAKNLGLARSRGDYVLFLDSDQQLASSVIEDCVSVCVRHGVEAVVIPEVFVGVTFWGACSALWKNSMVMAWGSSGGIPRFYRKGAVVKSGAFDVRLRFWEDSELYQRLKQAGLKGVRCNGQIVHYEVDSLRSVVRKYLSYGRSIAEFRRVVSKGPYASTFRLTLSTIKQVLRCPGASFSVFVGCFLLVIVKSFSAVIGFLSR